MKENLHEIDKLFRSVLSDNQELPPAHVWEQLETKLESEKVVSIESSYANLKRISVALLIVVFGFSFYQVDYWRSNADKLISKNSSANLHPTIKSEENSMADSSREKYRYDLHRGVGHGKIGVSILSSGRVPEEEIKHGQSMPDQHANSRSTIRIKETQGSIDTSVAYIGSSNTTYPYKESNQYPVSAWKTSAVGSDAYEKKEKDVKGKNVLQPAMEADMSVLASFSYLPTQEQLKTVVSIQAPGSIDIYPIGGETEKNSNGTFPSNKAENNLRTDMAGRLSLTGYYSWDHNMNRLQAGQSAHREDNRNEIKEKEDHVAAYSVGLLVDYQLTGKWMIETGLQFSRSLIKIAPKQAYARKDSRGNIRFRYNCSSGVTYLDPRRGAAPAIGDSMLITGSENNLQYLAVPLTFKYKLVNGRLAIFPELGLNLNFLLNQKISIVDNGNNLATEKANKIEGLKSSYISGIMGLDARYALSQKTAVIINPELRLGITAINQNAPVKSYQQSFGLVAGIQVTL